MAITTSYFASDLVAMIDDLPVTAKFASTEFSCSASELTTDETLILVGNVTSRVVRIIFRSTAFTVDSTFKPQARLQLKYPSPAAFSNYEIVSIALSPDFNGYEVTLKQDNRA